MCVPRTFMTPMEPITQTTPAVVKYAEMSIQTSLKLSTLHPSAEPSHSLSDSHLSTRQNERTRKARAELTTAPTRERMSAAALVLTRMMGRGVRKEGGVSECDEVEGERGGVLEKLKNLYRLIC